MTTASLLSINLLSPLLFYQNPADIYQTQTGSTQDNGLNREFSSCRGCNHNLSGDDPASQYQRQKIIQRTVRVPSSLYTMNLAGLSSYQKPEGNPQFVEQSGTTYVTPGHVYWNQMSDRAKPAHQTTKIASGTTYHTSSTRHSITRLRPGAMSPGGFGVDIKHNSYERRLHKLKGKHVLRRGIIPPEYGAPIPFNRAFPVYGGKIVKTGIINGCDCPNLDLDLDQDNRIYGSDINALQDQILSVTYEYHVGDFVLAYKYLEDKTLYKGKITDIVEGLYTVQFEDNVVRIVTYTELSIYVDCVCNPSPTFYETLLYGFPQKEICF